MKEIVIQYEKPQEPQPERYVIQYEVPPQEPQPDRYVTVTVTSLSPAERTIEIPIVRSKARRKKA